jgi:PAS domain S-box-containing protein
MDGDIFDLVHESVFTRDLGGSVRTWNKASEVLYGFDCAGAIGQAAHRLLRTKHREDLSELEAALLASGRWEGEFERRDAAGRRLLVEARWSLRRDAQGEPVEIIEVGRDVTERRATENALRENEYRYRNLFHAMAAAFWELEFNGVGDMLRGLFKQGVSDLSAHLAAHPGLVREMMRATRIIDVNDQCAALFAGGDRDAILASSVEPFWPEASTQVYAGAVVAAATGKASYAVECKLQTLSGRAFDALFTVCFTPETRADGRLLIGVIDISERVKAQDALRAVQAEFAHAARVSMLGELAASIAHEVNQPLAAIATNAAAGQRWLSRAEPDLEEVRALNARIGEDAHRAAAIIARVRAMAARRPDERASVLLSDIAGEALAFLHHELMAQGVALTISHDDATPPVLGDRTLLQQVVVNLAVNAMQAMADCPADVRRLFVRTAMNGDGAACVVIEDSGPGFLPDQQERLFETFYTTKAAGMGMGLAICRSIVESHGGAIDAGNRPGGGARFSFTLPPAPGAIIPK